MSVTSDFTASITAQRDAFRAAAVLAIANADAGRPPSTDIPNLLRLASELTAILAEFAAL